LALEAPALARTIRGVSAEKMDAIRGEIDLAEEMPLHEGSEAPRILRRHGQLVEIPSRAAGEGRVTRPVQPDQLAVDRHHRPTRGQNHAARTALPQYRGEMLRGPPRRTSRSGENPQPRISS